MVAARANFRKHMVLVFEGQPVPIGGDVHLQSVIFSIESFTGAPVEQLGV
jgi:hypothetical protein